jgi:hypothetical protein
MSAQAKKSADLIAIDATGSNVKLLSGVLVALWLIWLVAAWLEYANLYGVHLEWENRFGLIDDCGLIVGSPVAVYWNALRIMRRLNL